jgi:AcrR family transcriptional regulator
MARRRLDRDKIVPVALRLSRVVEPDAVSFRKIGAELTVDPTAVYRHFPGKSELISATLDALWTETVQLIPDGLEWRPRLERIAHEFYVAIQEHPAIGVKAGHRTTGGPGELAAVQMVLDALTESGLSPREVARFYPVYSASCCPWPVHKLRSSWRVRSSVPCRHAPGWPTISRQILNGSRWSTSTPATWSP